VDQKDVIERIGDVSEAAVDFEHLILDKTIAAKYLIKKRLLG
jgi:hypothetical protein